MGLPGIVLGVTSISLSAMMYWAFTFQGDGSRLPPVRLNQMLDREAGTYVLANIFSMSRSSENTHHTLDRQVVASFGGFRSSPPRVTTTDAEGAVVRDHSFPAPDTPGAGNGQSPQLVTVPDATSRAGRE